MVPRVLTVQHGPNMEDTEAVVAPDGDAALELVARTRSMITLAISCACSSLNETPSTTLRLKFTPNVSPPLDVTKMAVVLERK